MEKGRIEVTVYPDEHLSLRKAYGDITVNDILNSIVEFSSKVEISAMIWDFTGW